MFLGIMRTELYVDLDTSEFASCKKFFVLVFVYRNDTLKLYNYASLCKVSENHMLRKLSKLPLFQ